MLAERLGMTYARLKCEMRWDEVVDWMALDGWRAAMREHAEKEAEMRAS